MELKLKVGMRTFCVQDCYISAFSLFNIFSFRYWYFRHFLVSIFFPVGNFPFDLCTFLLFSTFYFLRFSIRHINFRPKLRLPKIHFKFLFLYHKEKDRISSLTQLKKAFYLNLLSIDK